MANRADGVDNPGESLEGDQNSVELASLKADVGSMSDQINKLTMMMAELVSKKEESSGTEESAADRGDAKESAAAGSAGAQGGAPQQIGSARDETYLRESSRESGPEGRHSGEAGGFVPREVSVAAAHNQGGFGSTIGSGAAAGFGGVFGVPAVGAGYQSVRYASPPFDGKAKNL